MDRFGLGLAGCGPDKAATDVTTTSVGGASYASNGTTAKLLAIDNNFQPGTLHITAGTTVEFANNGRNAHNVTPVGDLQRKSWGVGEGSFKPTQNYSHLFDRPGLYKFFCTIHGTAKAGMVGQIEVTAPDAASTSTVPQTSMPTTSTAKRSRSQQ